jgi:threonine dehydratase
MTQHLAISLPDIEAAAERLRGQIVRTPLLRHDALDALAGGRLFVKAEPLQRTGSFKFRGAYNRISQLSVVQREAGVVAFSSGNHAQGVALAARLLGCRAIILMPADAPAIKIRATRAMGADVRLFDRLRDNREAMGAEIARETGAVLVPPYDDPHIMAGQGTIGLEIIDQLDELGVSPDVVSACASGGGMIAGIATAVAARVPSARIVVAEPAGFDDHARSLASGARTAVIPGATTLCDALMAPIPGELTFPVNHRLLAGAVSATDDEVLDAMANAFLHLKLVVEPGGAVALAAALNGRLALNGGVGVVVASGGNVDPGVFQRALSRL